MAVNVDRLVTSRKITFNTGLLLKELQKRGVNLSRISGSPAIVAVFKKQKELLYDIYSSLLPYSVGWILSDKFYTKKVLQDIEVSVAMGECFSISMPELIKAYAAQIGYPVVLKPTVGSHGDHVFVDIQNPAELENVLNECMSSHSGNGYYLLETYIQGNEYRVFYTRNGFFAVVQRIPASIVGNGKDSLLELIKKENYRRMHPRNTCLCEIPMDSISRQYIARRNISWDTIPKNGEQVFLRANSNVSTGGDCIDVTDVTHESFRLLASKILTHFSGLKYIGFDVLCPDISKPFDKKTGIVCELNPAPGLSLHMMPNRGTSRNVAGALADELFPETIQ